MVLSCRAELGLSDPPPPFVLPFHCANCTRSAVTFVLCHSAASKQHKCHSATARCSYLASGGAVVYSSTFNFFSYLERLKEHTITDRLSYGTCDYCHRLDCVLLRHYILAAQPLLSTLTTKLHTVPQAILIVSIGAMCSCTGQCSASEVEAVPAALLEAARRKASSRQASSCRCTKAASCREQRSVTSTPDLHS